MGYLFLVVEWLGIFYDIPGYKIQIFSHTRFYAARAQSYKKSRRFMIHSSPSLSTYNIFYTPRTHLTPRAFSTPPNHLPPLHFPFFGPDGKWMSGLFGTTLTGFLSTSTPAP